MFNNYFKNDYDCEKYLDKFGQFTKKRETAMKFILRETTLLVKSTITLLVFVETSQSNP